MLLKLSKLTNNDNDKRCYINTRMIVTVGAVAGYPGKTLIIMANNSQAIIEKPADDVIEMLKEHDRELAV